MTVMYNEYKNLDLLAIANDVAKRWQELQVFEKSVSTRDGNPAFTFYEGPPSANGMPGIHHVLGRTIKDIFCRYKTLKGYKVLRKGGWDTHGLPVELQVEKRLGLKKDDIGDKISVADYNAECRKDVMQFKEVWEDLTTKMGYWVDMEKPYITYERDYIESVWNLLKRLFDKELLYRGYTIQPYSPAAGTGLSSHELNQPGTYRNVKDVSCTAQFKVANTENEFFLAWTTTPWTLPSNAALAVGANITYQKLETINPYTEARIVVYLAKDLVSQYFKEEGLELDFDSYSKKAKVLPYRVLSEMKGKELVGMRYEQLLDYVVPEGDAFRVIEGDFVTTEDGTGIVHIAPTFGADDQRVAKQQGIPAITVADPKNPLKQIPLVDKQGKFVAQMGEFAGRYVKNYTDDPDYVDVNVDICVKLKGENKAFRIEKYEHNYPHCWRTDKPVLYYPLEAWFIKTTAFKDRLVELNKTINWKPEHTGTGRFGNWLENLVDWNLSRSRFWGTPLPIWSTEDGDELKCIGSIEELETEVEKAIAAGLMKEPLPADFDLHRPFVDDVVLVSPNGKPMNRVPDVVDVWFDSGAMPYAQWHFPFENKEVFEQNFPADFIAEGVDQTRGWFFTLHAIATMLFDSVAFKNVVANGLVLDKDGNKMSKRLGNTVDPFATINTYGPDALRWYMVHNAQPWDNLKFDVNGVDEVRRKFFGTLHNTYQFFALYANIDNFSYSEDDIAYEQRPEIDRWILSELNSLIKRVDEHLNDYDPTKAVRLVYDFTIDNLSNWYVRLCRRRFWKGDYTEDKISAYQTLYTCLETICKLGSVFAPFYLDKLFVDLNRATGKDQSESVHLSHFPEANNALIDKQLEQRMELAQKVCSLGLGLRKKAQIRVRQPLQKMLIPALSKELKEQFGKIYDLVQSELNVKEIELIDDSSQILTKTIKPDFKALGPKLGGKIKFLKPALAALSQAQIQQFEQEGTLQLVLDGADVTLQLQDVEIQSDDIEGWLVANAGGLVVALDVHLTDSLQQEGMAREIVNRIQNIRKSEGFEVTDRIKISIEQKPQLLNVIERFTNYICTETLADQLILVGELSNTTERLDLDGMEVGVLVTKVQN
ncbi:isoleucine--tRNA ligase [bacterium]|nr:isoleucine--tRNA ligase [bacterium]